MGGLRLKPALACPADNTHYETFTRAGGDCVCPKCNKLYYDHPYCPGTLTYEGGSGYYWLHVLCDGSHVKL